MIPPFLQIMEPLGLAAEGGKSKITFRNSYPRSRRLYAKSGRLAA